MPKIQVPSGNAVAVRRAKGSDVTVVNQSAVDVYFDRNADRLNRSLDGAIPDGTLLPAGGFSVSFPSFAGEMWFRAATATSIEVQP